MMAAKNYSIVEYYAEHEGYRCGYCKSTDTNYSHGMWAHSMSVQDYQDLIDRGWRRSGLYCYKPTMNVTCCPMYTIRCAALELKISKSQKKVLKRVHRFLSHGDTKSQDDTKSPIDGSRASDISGDISMGIPELHEKALHAPKRVEINASTLVDQFLTQRSDTPQPQTAQVKNVSADIVAPDQAEIRKPCRPVSGQDVSHPPCKKAKLIRKERKQQKLLNKGYSPQDVAELIKAKAALNQGKLLEDFLNEPLPVNPSHRLEIRLVRSSPVSKEFEQTCQQAYEMYRKYQMAVHGDPADKCTQRQYTRFLVKSPLQPWAPSDGPPQGYGSFHQQYWIDGQLIAVGVIDILPHCISSVYFYYDPDFSQLSLGTYASLRELSLTRSLHQHAPSLKYYYMGYYIHSCAKMRYKASYLPSFLLCPETYSWFSVAECKQRLDVAKYCRFNQDPNAKDDDGQLEINEVLVLFHQRILPYYIYLALNTGSRDVDDVNQYAKLVGMKCARRMLLVRS